MFAVISMIAKLIGALYRIPLTNVMGAEGIGLYQMVFPLYTVLLTATSGGLPAAVAKVTAGYNATGDARQARRTLYVTLAAVSSVTTLVAAALALLRNRIAFIQGNPLAAVSYLGIAPSIVLVGVISCFRGWYQGSHNMLPSALSQLIEQAVKLAAGLTLSRMLLPYGVQHAVLGAVLGVTISEAAALFGLLLQYFFTRRAERARTVVRLPAFGRMAAEVSAELAPAARPVTRAELLRRVYRVALPVTLGSLVIPVTQVIDSILVVNMLARAAGTAAATSLYGVLNGPVNSLINMPVVVTMAVSVALLPKVSAASATGSDCARTTETALRYSLLIALPAALALAVFSREILSVLYARSVRAELLDAGAALLRYGSVTVVYTAFIQVSTAVLQGCDRPKIPAVNLVIGAAVKVLATVALLRLIGIYGAVTASALCYGVTAALDAASLMKYAPVRPPFVRTVALPLICAAAAIGGGYGTFVLLSAVLPALWALVSAAVVIVALYGAGLFLSGCLTRAELLGLPAVNRRIDRAAKGNKKKRKNRAKSA